MNLKDRFTGRTLSIAILVLLVLAGGLFMLSRTFGEFDSAEEEEGRSRWDGIILPDVVNAAPTGPLAAAALPPNGFTPQLRLGYTSGDQWEPAIAADRFGHIFVLYPQYLGVPGCAACYSPTMILTISSDRGATWSAPAVIYPDGQASGQWDAQIVVDPTDGKTVYASWLQNGKSDTLVARSTNSGATWSVVTANHTNAGTDKPILAVRGNAVYVAYNHSQRAFVAVSHDGGATFSETALDKSGKLGWALAGGGAIDSTGRVFFGWAGYEGSGGAKGNVNLFVSRSTDGGATWALQQLDVSSPPPDCAAYQCGWAFLGAQLTLATDAGGTLYALWNGGPTSGGPERIYLARSTDGGKTWSAKQDVSSAPSNANHAFPAIVAAGTGDLSVAWMDTRAGTLWNTTYRHSSNGGQSWSPEVDLSTSVPGYAYIQSGGYSFPFGDYFEMDRDDQGTIHVIWGEGQNYRGPGSIWYTRGQ